MQRSFPRWSMASCLAAACLLLTSPALAQCDSCGGCPNGAASIGCDACGGADCGKCRGRKMGGKLGKCKGCGTNGCKNGGCKGGGASAFLGKGPLGQAFCRRGMTHCRGPEYGDPDLFRNYWVGPGCDAGCDCMGGAGGIGGGSGGAAAQLYIAPRPTPAYVGHVYYTNEAVMPHELLYAHRRTFHRYYNEGRGLTRAKTRYYTPLPVAIADSLQSLLRPAR